MSYSETLKKLEDSRYLLSMVSVDELLRFGFSMGLSAESKVLDLCCGYGTVLKIWHEAFGIRGTGVDLWGEAISQGTERMEQAGIHSGEIRLLQADVLSYQDSDQYDVVICSETFGSIPETLRLGAEFLKPGGTLAYQKVYSKIPVPPQELLDFEGEVLPLEQLRQIFSRQGYAIAHMASDSPGEWERYITWSARRDLEHLQRNPDDEARKEWLDKWYRMYFEYRRPYQGQAMFGLLKL